MHGLTLAHPQALWLLAGALPVVLLYVLKTRRARVRVPSTWLWAAARRDLMARTPWKRFQREVPLALELLALAALALAAAGPGCRGGADPGRRLVVVVDASASMGARDVRTGRTRMDEARDAARALLDAQGIGGEAMLVRAGHDARVLVPLGRDRDAMRAALALLSALDVEGDVGAALALASDRLRTVGGDRRVVLLTDAAGAVDATRVNTAVPVQVITVGRPQDNLGIVRVDVRTARQSGASGEHGEVVQAFALVANHGQRARDVFVTAQREGERDVSASRRVRVEPGRREPVVLSFPFARGDEGRGLVVRVDPGDELPADDVAYGRIPPGARLPVVLASRAAQPWVRRALAADPDVDLIESADDSSARAAIPPGALLVYEGLCPAALPPQRDALILAPPRGACAGTTVAPTVAAPVVSAYANADPRFRFLSMDGVHVGSASPLRLGPGTTELLRAGNDVLIADASTPDRAVTVVGMDVGDTDWPLRASFVLFVRNVEELARAHRSRAAVAGGRAGEPLRIALPAGARGVRVQGPAGSVRAAVGPGAVVVGETSRAGFYRVGWEGGTALAPVNLLSDSESDLRAAAGLGPNGLAAGANTARLPDAHRDASPWLAAAATLALLADVLWFTRREKRSARPAPKPTEPARA